MELKDKDLKDLYQSHIKENPPHQTGCPDVGVLIQSFSTEMSENEKIKVIDHISSCGECYEKFEIVRQILKESKKLTDQFKGLLLSETEVQELKQKALDRIHEFETSGDTEKKASFLEKFIATFKAKSAYKYATAIAGVFIVALAALFVFKIPQTLQESALRGEKLKSVLLIFPQGELTELPTKFKWSSVPGAKEYQVVLLDDELTRLWNSEKTEKNEMPIPSEVQNKLQRAKIFYWKVVLLFGDGTKKESDLQEFRLAKKNIFPD